MKLFCFHLAPILVYLTYHPRKSHLRNKVFFFLFYYIGGSSGFFLRHYSTLKWPIYFIPTTLHIFYDRNYL